MNRKPNHRCAVCGHTVEENAGYWLAADPLTSRLTLSRIEEPWIQGSRAACDREHVLELVAHWMASGTLDFTFARNTPVGVPRDPGSMPTVRSANPCAQPKPLAELTVNRECL